MTLVGCGAAQVPTAAVPPIKRCLILATNDSESHFDGPKLASGEYAYPIARVAAVKKRELAKHPGAVLLVEAGDVLQGRYMERQDANPVAARHAALTAYGAAGYDFMTLGNHEFDAGPGLPLAMVEAGDLSNRHWPLVLSANVKLAEPGGGWRAPLPSARVPCGGIDLGLLGLLTPSTKTISDAGATRIEDPASTARSVRSSMEAQAFLVLSHLGVDDDVQLAKDVTGIDVIIGGHSHTALQQPIRVGRTAIGQAGSRFAYLAFWELTELAGKLDVRYHLEAIDEHMPIDVEVKAQVDAVRQTLIPEVVIGERKSAWDLVDVAHSSYPPRATRAVVEYAQRVTGQHVDGALLNVGGFRSATVYPPGPVTNVEVRAVHPFKNRLTLVKLTGAQLKAVLENACTTGHSERHGRNLVAWGVQFECAIDKPAIVYEMRDNAPVAVASQGQRATAMVNGKPLDLNASYTIVTLDYLAKGGSNYFAFTQTERKCMDGKPFEPKTPCPGTPLLSAVIEEAVRDGSLDRPLP